MDTQSAVPAPEQGPCYAVQQFDPQAGRLSLVLMDGVDALLVKGSAPLLDRNV